MYKQIAKGQIRTLTIGRSLPFTYWEVGLQVRYFYSLEHPLFTRKMILAKFRYISNTHRPDAWTYITGRTRVPPAKEHTPYMQILQIYKMSRT